MSAKDREHASATLRRIAASGAPAFMWAAIGCPFDVIKTRVQTATVPFASPAHCLVWTVRRQGPQALWKGFLPQLLVALPYSVIMFGVYDWLKPTTGSGIAGSFLAGAASGVAVTTVHNPLELWRVRVQTHLRRSGDDGGSSRGAGSTTSSVLRGLRKQPWQLGRGASMTLLENVVGNGVFFSANEVMRRRLAKSGGDHSSTNRACLDLSQEALVGALTGIIFQLVVYPADLIKARLMTQEAVQARHVAQKILREGGVRGLYRGASVTILRAAVINAAGWPALRAAEQCLLGL